MSTVKQMSWTGEEDKWQRARFTGRLCTRAHSHSHARLHLCAAASSALGQKEKMEEMFTEMKCFHMVEEIRSYSDNLDEGDEGNKKIKGPLVPCWPGSQGKFRSFSSSFPFTFSPAFPMWSSNSLSDMTEAIVVMFCFLWQQMIFLGLFELSPILNTPLSLS